MADVQVLPLFVQIDQVLADKARCGTLANHVDNLLMMISIQARLGLSQHFSDPEVNKQDLVSLYRCLMSILLGVSTSLKFSTPMRLNIPGTRMGFLTTPIKK